MNPKISWRSGLALSVLLVFAALTACATRRRRPMGRRPRSRSRVQRERSARHARYARPRYLSARTVASVSSGR